MMLCIIMTAFGMVSCGETEDNDPLAIKSINVEYNLNLSQNWFDFYDVVVTYLDENGQSKSLTVTEKWNFGFSMSPNNAPRNYAFSVVATPKKDHPEINDAQYILSQEIDADFFCYRYDGTVFKELSSDLCAQKLTSNDVLTFSGSQFKDYLESGSRNLMSFSKSWDGKY